MSESTPLISVIIPAYKTRSTIGETLDSVLAQTFSDYEIVVVDDGSPDDSAEFVAQNYPQVRLVRQENRGLAAARNSGIREARGKFVAFLDSDDVWMAGKLKKQSIQIKSHPEADVYYTDCHFWRNGKHVGKWSEVHRQKAGVITRELIKREVMLPVLTVVARREAVLRVGGFDEQLREVEDYDLWLRLALSGSHFRYLDEPTALYRLSDGQMSGNNLKMAQTQLKVYRKLEGSQPDPAFAADIAGQIKIFELEVLHQRRRKAVAKGDRKGAALVTLKMMRVAPERSVRILVASFVALIVPQKYR